MFSVVDILDGSIKEDGEANFWVDASSYVLIISSNRQPGSRSDRKKDQIIGINEILVDRDIQINKPTNYRHARSTRFFIFERHILHY